MLIDQLINNLGICVCSIYLPTYLTSTYILTFVNQNFKKVEPWEDFLLFRRSNIDSERDVVL